MMILMNGIGQRLIFKAQPEVEKFNLKLNKKKAASPKPQAPSLTVTEGYYRIQLERNKYGYRTIKKNRGCIRRDFASC